MQCTCRPTNQLIPDGRPANNNNDDSSIKLVRASAEQTNEAGRGCGNVCLIRRAPISWPCHPTISFGKPAEAPRRRPARLRVCVNNSPAQVNFAGIGPERPDPLQFGGAPDFRSAACPSSSSSSSLPAAKENKFCAGSVGDFKMASVLGGGGRASSGFVPGKRADSANWKPKRFQLARSSTPLPPAHILIRARS